MNYQDALRQTPDRYKPFVTGIKRWDKETKRNVVNAYMAVDGRVLMAMDEAVESKHPVKFESEFSEIAGQLVCTTTVSTIRGTVTADARAFLNETSGASATNPLEVAQTSSYGRALGFLGYGLFGGGIASAEEVMNAQENGTQLEPTQAGPEPKREQKEPDRPAYDDDFKRRRFWASVNNAKKKTNKSNEELKAYILDKFEVTTTNDLTEEQRREALAWMWQPKEETSIPDEAHRVRQQVRELIESHNIDGEAPTQKWIVDMIRGSCDAYVPAGATDPLSHVEDLEYLAKIKDAIIQLTKKEVANEGV